MPIKKLPIECDPYQFAKERVEFTGTVNADQMERLNALVLVPCGDVDITLSFDYDDEYVVINGQLSLQVKQQCQRCMQAMDIPLSSQFQLAPVTGDMEAKQLPAHIEAVFVAENRLNLIELIEEEILLSLPQEAKHEDANCFSIATPAKMSETIRPFADLKQMLMRDTK